MKRYNSSGSLADSAFCTDLFTFLKPAQIPVFIIQNKKWEQRHLALVWAKQTYRHGVQLDAEMAQNAGPLGTEKMLKMDDNAEHGGKCWNII